MTRLCRIRGGPFSREHHTRPRIRRILLLVRRTMRAFARYPMPTGGPSLHGSSKSEPKCPGTTTTTIMRKKQRRTSETPHSRRPPREGVRAKNTNGESNHGTANRPWSGWNRVNIIKIKTTIKIIRDRGSSSPWYKNLCTSVIWRSRNSRWCIQGRMEVWVALEARRARRSRLSASSTLTSHRPKKTAKTCLVARLSRLSSWGRWERPQIRKWS